MKPGFVYIVTNRADGILYTGVTADLERRTGEHRQGLVPGFTKKYGCTRLVWYEAFGDIGAAIAREKRIKAWKRAWKVRLVLQTNPEWRDLWFDFFPEG